MPTYDYICRQCGNQASVIQSIHAYVNARSVPNCHGAMDRHFTVMPGMSGLANALAGDRHYDGQRTADGVDISTRSKHRAYMKAKGLTTMDDYKDTWAKAAKERAELRAGTQRDPTLRKTLESVVPQFDK